MSEKKLGFGFFEQAVTERCGRYRDHPDKVRGHGHRHGCLKSKLFGVEVTKRGPGLNRESSPPGERKRKKRSEAERQTIELSKNDLRERGDTRSAWRNYHGQPWEGPCKNGEGVNDNNTLSQWIEGVPRGTTKICREALLEIVDASTTVLP